MLAGLGDDLSELRRSVIEEAAQRLKLFDVMARRGMNEAERHGGRAGFAEGGHRGAGRARKLKGVEGRSRLQDYVERCGPARPRASAAGPIEEAADVREGERNRGPSVGEFDCASQ